MSFRTLAVLFTILLGLAAAGGPAPRVHAQAAGIEGSWLILLPGFDDERELGSFLPGGVMLTTNQPTTVNRQGAHEYNSAGHGTWVSLGGSRYAFAVQSLTFDDRGALLTIFAIDGVITVSDDGDHFEGTLIVRGLTPTGEERFATPPETILGTRIRPPTGR